ncbi:unnamed protein product, partial [Ectocarpus sp. 8 AP-2014]
TGTVLGTERCRYENSDKARAAEPSRGSRPSHHREQRATSPAARSVRSRGTDQGLRGRRRCGVSTRSRPGRARSGVRCRGKLQRAARLGGFGTPGSI